jgi:hypothetical protein
MSTTVEEKYPEHEKIMGRKVEHQAIQNFLDYLRYEAGVQGLVKGEHVEEPTHDGRVYFDPLGSTEATNLISGFFGVDAKAFEEEKRVMLLEMRRHH